MTEPATVLELRQGDLEPLVTQVEAMVAAGSGWVTLLPGVPENAAPPPRSLLARLFSGVGPAVPVCTWVAPIPRQRPPHVEVGILHAAGPKAVAALTERSVRVPEGWVVLSDHPRRGLVVAVHPDASAQDSVGWLVSAGAALCLVPLTGTWRAEIYR